ncbi:hypothetical protein D3C76_1317250 [compost metagenome]
MHNGPAQGAVSGIGESINLDLHWLSSPDKAHILVQHHDFGVQLRSLWHNHQQLLRWLYRTAQGMHRQLLHHAINRCQQRLQALLVAPADQLLLENGNVLLGAMAHVVLLALGPGQKTVALILPVARLGL